MAAHDSGVQVECPGCGRTVLQKAMIPVLGEGGQGIRYLCVGCARALVVTTSPSDPPADPEHQPEAEPAGGIPADG